MKNKKKIAILSTFALLFAGVAFVGHATNHIKEADAAVVRPGSNGIVGGLGTEGSPFMVTSADGLKTAIENKTETFVILMSDIKLDDSLTIPEGETVSMDLNGHSISTKEYGEAEPSKVYTAIENHGNLTIKSGPLKSHSTTIENHGILNIEGATLNSQSTAIENHGDLGMKSCTLNCPSTAIDNYGNLNVESTTIYPNNPTVPAIRTYSGGVTTCDQNSDIPAGVEDVVEEHTHNWGKGVVTTAPNYGSTGIRTYTCSCGATTTEVIAKLVYGHNHTFDEGVVTTAPTTSAPGVKTFTCTGCGATNTMTLPKLEHTPVEPDPHTHDWGEGKVTKEPTCGATGVRTYTCSCGETKTEEIPATGNHTWDKGIVTTQPSYSSTGVRTYTCTVCGATRTEEVAQLDRPHTHDWGEGKVTTAPTYKTTGIRTYTCSCGETKTEVIDKLVCQSHEWNEGVVTTAPTTSAPGVRTYTCTICEEHKTEEIAQLEESVRIYSVDGNVSSDLGLRFYVNSEDYADKVGKGYKVCIEVKKAIYNGNDISRYETYTLSDPSYQATLSDVSYEVFAFNGIKFYEMTSEITVTTYTVSSDGTRKDGTAKTTSFAKYAQQVYNKYSSVSGTETKMNLLKSLLQTGTYAQQDRNYHLSDLANSYIPA